MPRAFSSAVYVFAAAVLCACTAPVLAAEAAPAAREVTAKITRLDLFRDATVAVYRQLDTGKAGETLRAPLDDAILFSSLSYDPALVGSIARARWVGAEAANYYKNALRPYLGKAVDLTLSEDVGLASYSGTLAAPKDWAQIGEVGRAALLTDKGVVTFPLSALRSISAKDGLIPATQSAEKYGLAVSLTKDGAPAVSYVSTGIGWAPYCEIHLMGEDKIRFRQYAEVLNEFGDFENVPIALVSGDSRAAFEKKLSLLSPNQTWGRFLVLKNVEPWGSAAASMGTKRENVIRFLDTPQNMGGTDISFKQVGNWSLKKNDALNIPLIDGVVGCRRLVKWEVKDGGDWQGAFRNNTADNPAYDSVIFKNPFEEPIVDSPVAVYADGRVLAQSQIDWVNARAEATVRLAAAPGLEGSFEDTLAPKQPTEELTTLGGRDYRKALVEGKLTLKNLRDVPMNLAVSRTFEGELISAQGDPHLTSLPQMYDVNYQLRLVWKLTLAPGESKTFTYSYTQLRQN